MFKVFWRTTAWLLLTILTFIVGAFSGGVLMMWVDGKDEAAHEYNKHIFESKK